LPPRQAAQGFAYVVVLLLVAVTGTGAAALGPLWHTAMQREKERELIFIGQEFRRAIGRYHASGSGLRVYPRQLEDLVRDPRQPGVRRHLRRIPVDPMTGQAAWGLVQAPDGGIIGVHSLSQKRPLKVAGFDTTDQDLADKDRYADWQFVYRAPASPAPPVGWKPAAEPPR
jgi:type II secretory pathway pseudopilin PulG